MACVWLEGRVVELLARTTVGLQFDKGVEAVLD